jgi:hypothetical protein
LGEKKSGFIRQVTSQKRLNSYKMFYDKTRKGLPFNTGEFNNSRVIIFQYAKKKVPKFKKSHSADDQSQQHFPDPKTKGRDTVGKIYLISVGKK